MRALQDGWSLGTYKQLNLRKRRRIAATHLILGENFDGREIRISWTVLLQSYILLSPRKFTCLTAPYPSPDVWSLRSGLEPRLQGNEVLNDPS